MRGRQQTDIGCPFRPFERIPVRTPPKGAEDLSCANSPTGRDMCPARARINVNYGRALVVKDASNEPSPCGREPIADLVKVCRGTVRALHISDHLFDGTVGTEQTMALEGRKVLCKR